MLKIWTFAFIVGCLLPCGRAFGDDGGSFSGQIYPKIDPKLFEKLNESEEKEYLRYLVPRKLLRARKKPILPKKLGEKDCEDKKRREHEEAKKDYKKSKEWMKEYYKDRKALGKKLDGFLDGFDNDLLERLRKYDPNALDEFMKKLEGKSADLEIELFGEMPEQEADDVGKGVPPYGFGNSVDLHFKDLHYDREIKRWRYNDHYEKHALTCGCEKPHQLKLRVCKQNPKLMPVPTCLEIDFFSGLNDLSKLLLRGEREKKQSKKCSKDDAKSKIGCSIDRQVEETKKELDDMSVDDFENPVDCFDLDFGKINPDVLKQYEQSFKTYEYLQKSNSYLYKVR